MDRQRTGNSHLQPHNLLNRNWRRTHLGQTAHPVRPIPLAPEFWQSVPHQPTSVMKPFPHLVLFVTAAAFYALPMSLAAAGTLLFAAALSAIICIDYPQRYRGLRLPKRVCLPKAVAKTRPVFKAPPLPAEANRLAA